MIARRRRSKGTKIAAPRAGPHKVPLPPSTVINRTIALDRVGSTDPEKLRAALAATNIPADLLIVPYRGIKFDATGQKELVRPILMQVQKGKYCTIYRFELASCPVLFPTPTWAEKAKL